MRRVLKVLILIWISPLSLCAQVQTHASGILTQGRAASRPTSCAAGDTYFSTDTEEYSRCESSDTWAIFRKRGNVGPSVRSHSVVDVTEYGAKGDGVTDDTRAIQAAINTACAGTGGADVYFPPSVYSTSRSPKGNYIVSQPQAPNNGPIFEIPAGCRGAGNGVSFRGGNSTGNSELTAAYPPKVVLNVACGGHPGLGPVFLFGSAQNVYMEHLGIWGCNQAIQVNGNAAFYFKNVDQTIKYNSGTRVCSSPSTCTTDNVPFAVYNDLEGIYEGGAIQNPNSTAALPSILLVSTGGNGTGIMQFKDLTFAGSTAALGGGGILGESRAGGGPIGSIFVHGGTSEVAGDTPIVKLTSTNGSDPNSTQKIHIENFIASDNNPGTPCLDLSGYNYYADITLINNACSGTGGPGIVVHNGILVGALIIGGLFSGHHCEDGNGKPVGGCTWQTTSGFDFNGGINSYASPSLQTNAIYTNGFFGNSQSCPIGMTSVSEGRTNRGLCIDPTFGLAFGPGGGTTTGQVGYDTRIFHSGHAQVGLALARGSSPTGQTATTQPGAGLPDGNYTYFVESTMNSSCTAASGYGQAATVATSTGKNQVLVTWNAASGSHIGYCVFRQRGSHYVHFFVSGTGTTRFLDTGATGTAGTPNFTNNTFPTNPQYTFGLAGIGSSNGNMVGRVKLSGGTNAITFSPPYNSAPVCITNDETTAGGSKASTTQTTLIITGKTGDVVDYICVGNPD